MTIYGWDMSHYDAPSIGNAVSQGISFITHKAGGDATDQELDEWWANVKGLPESVLLGAYWVLTPGSPASKARSFLSRLDSVCKGWRDRDAFILQLDAEMWNGDPSTRPSIGECNTFCSVLAAAGKWVPIGYLPKWVYGSVSGFGYPVWASSYVSGSGGFKSLYPGDSSSRWDGYGKAVTILQYTSSAIIGGQTTCDANAYRGTLDQLKSIVTPGWDADMDLTTENLDAIEARMLHALKNWTEDDPDSTTTPPGQGRVGGWIRMANQRERGRFDALSAQITALAGSLTPDAFAAAVVAKLPTTSDPVSQEEVTNAVKEAFAEAFAPPAS